MVFQNNVLLGASGSVRNGAGQPLANRFQNTEIIHSYQDIVTINQQTIDKLTSDFQQQQVLNEELNIKLKASEAYGDNLAKKLREHDLTMLTLRKPGLIERRVNSATKQVFEDLESSTATDPN